MRKSQLKRSPPKKTNPARRRKEFARCYGSKARVEFVRSLPCAACGVVGYSENAHIETGGTGRKADYDKIIPLCGIKPDRHETLIGGCHEDLHWWGRNSFETVWGISLTDYAASTQAAWLSSLGSAPGGQT